MRIVLTSAMLFIGWDVGGWNCDRNPKSRDAIVILDGSAQLVGETWRGNLRKSISDASTSDEWLRDLLSRCEADAPAAPFHATMAIDTPLGFPDEFVDLVTRRSSVEPSDASPLNQYLYRSTERHLSNRGLNPMSSVKDMIGSQATKGMHTLAKFAPIVESCGVWTDGAGFRAIETYPTACRDTLPIKRLLKGRSRLIPDDVEDARMCALVALLFATDRDALEGPAATVSSNEGWIWAPRVTK